MRSFGEDPQQVGNLVAAYIRGAHSAGMMTTAKHFPGHGDTATDSHLGVASVSANMARLPPAEDERCSGYTCDTVAARPSWHRGNVCLFAKWHQVDNGAGE